MKEYISFSAIGRYNECEAKALAIDKGEFTETQTKAMLSGQVFEAIVLDMDMPEGIYKKNGEPYAEFRDAIAAGMIAKHELQTANILNGSRFQVKKEAGVLLGIADIEDDENIYDLKYLKDVKDTWVEGMLAPFWYKSQYDKQLAIYRELFPGKDYHLLVYTKETPPNKRWVQFDRGILDRALEEIETKDIPRILEVRETGKAKRCELCDYCRSTSKLIKEEACISEF